MSPTTPNGPAGSPKKQSSRIVQMTPEKATPGSGTCEPGPTGSSPSTFEPPTGPLPADGSNSVHAPGTGQPYGGQMNQAGFQPELGHDTHQCQSAGHVAQAVVALLSAHRYTGLNEADYHDQAEHILGSDPALVTAREVHLTGTDRIDLVVNGTVGVEVKTQGTRSAIIRQLGRYAATGELTHLILASSKIMLVKNLPAQIHGVPVTAVVLRGSIL